MAKGSLDKLLTTLGVAGVERFSFRGTTFGKPLIDRRGGGSRNTLEADFERIKTVIAIRRVGREIAADELKQK